MAQLPRICVIGAGSCGIATAKVLHTRGFDFDCYEKSDRVGGNWVFNKSNGMSAAYRSLHINTSRERMQYSDFTMPRGYPDFPHHSLIADYFDRYVDHFGFRDKIVFNTSVEKAIRRADGQWEISLDTGATRLYDALAVANGHHRDPRWPDPPFPGTFDGVQMHAHSYIDNESFVGKSVVVLGMGNSAMDIAVEVSKVARKTFLAARRGAHVLPKYLLGRPVDQWVASPLVPFRIRQLVLASMLRIQVGRIEKYGLPKPDHRVLEASPTMSDTILTALTHGDVVAKPNIAELMGDKVKFADGSVAEVDAIIYCTGYRVTFPFFDPDFISAPNNDLPLFRRVFKPGLDNLFFIGLLQPLGAIMPLAEVQSYWIADYMQGKYALPDLDVMKEDMERERKALQQRYVRSERHTMQVDYEDYLYHLDRERKRGAKRASRAKWALPVKSSAAEEQ
jgi:dimethylaniline monooxygenase (N-oxide forming)